MNLLYEADYQQSHIDKKRSGGCSEHFCSMVLCRETATCQRYNWPVPMFTLSRDCLQLAAVLYIFLMLRYYPEITEVS